MVSPRWYENPDGTGLMLESTGEEPDWELYRIQSHREERGECPNGCGDTMQILDAHSLECAQCHYHRWGNVPHGRKAR